MKKFIPVPDSIFAESDAHLVFESIYFHLLKLFDHQILSPELIDEYPDFPESAKTAWYLWHFAMEVSSSGLPDYLSNHCPSVQQIKLTRHALAVVAADELKMLLDAAIPFARDGSKEYGEFSVFPQDVWFEQFDVSSSWPEPDLIAETSLRLAGLPLSSLVGTYLRAHREELQCKGGGGV